jgi:predicted CoA-binding protein
MTSEIYGNIAGGGWKNPSPEEIEILLLKAKTIAVVGLSSNSARASYRVTEYLQSVGYKIIPINPQESEILGEKSFPDLKSVPVPVDIVDVFRRPDAALAIVEEAVAIGAKAVWLQESVISIEAFSKGIEAGMIMVMDRCIYKEHIQLHKG